jgi:hypothetical protein
VHTALGSFGMAHPLQSENEQNRGDQVTEFYKVGLHVNSGSCLLRKC